MTSESNRHNTLHHKASNFPCRSKVPIYRQIKDEWLGCPYGLLEENGNFSVIDIIPARLKLSSSKFFKGNFMNIHVWSYSYSCCYRQTYIFPDCNQNSSYKYLWNIATNTLLKSTKCYDLVPSAIPENKIFFIIFPTIYWDIVQIQI